MSRQGSREGCESSGWVGVLLLPCQRTAYERDEAVAAANARARSPISTGLGTLTCFADLPLMQGRAWRPRPPPCSMTPHVCCSLPAAPPRTSFPTRPLCLPHTHSTCAHAHAPTHAHTHTRMHAYTHTPHNADDGRCCPRAATTGCSSLCPACPSASCWPSTAPSTSSWRSRRQTQRVGGWGPLGGWQGLCGWLAGCARSRPSG